VPLRCSVYTPANPEGSRTCGRTTPCGESWCPLTASAQEASVDVSVKEASVEASVRDVVLIPLQKVTVALPTKPLPKLEVSKDLVIWTPFKDHRGMWVQPSEAVAGIPTVSVPPQYTCRGGGRQCWYTFGQCDQRSRMNSYTVCKKKGCPLKVEFNQKRATKYTARLASCATSDLKKI
jgi:hypothetical protein